MTYRPVAVATLVIVAGLAAPVEVLACDYMLGPGSHPRYPWWSAERFPTNGLFRSSLEWRDEAGTLLELVRDDDFSEQLGLEVRRPAAGELAAGAVYFTTEDCPETGACDHRLEVADGPDLIPPERAVIAELRTELVRDPVDTGAFSCPDLDRLVIDVDGDDDTTPREHLTMVAYIAEDEAAAATREEIDAAFGYDLGPPGRPLVSTIAIGEAVDRSRDGEPFRAAGRFCFALALMDWAGNLGERSEVRCLDTTDPDDPTVVWVEGQGCACAASRGRNAPDAVTIFVLAALWLARRRARPDR